MRPSPCCYRCAGRRGDEIAHFTLFFILIRIDYAFVEGGARETAVVVCALLNNTVSGLGSWLVNKLRPPLCKLLRIKIDRLIRGHISALTWRLNQRVAVSSLTFVLSSTRRCDALPERGNIQ